MDATASDRHDAPMTNANHASIVDPQALSLEPLAVRTCWPLAAIPVLKLLLHLLANVRGGYGFFRDELYYLASTRYLDWGYVDHPPLSVWLLAGVRAVLGDSLFAVRLLPALAGTAVVVVVMLLARELGGGRWGMALAGLAALVSPVYLAFAATYSMNTFDVLIWAVAAWILARHIRTGAPHLWLWLGLVLGVGLLNKVSVLWLGAGVVVTLVATPLRRWLATPWPWLGGLLAGALFVPYVLWNVFHEWAHLEFMHNAVTSKYAGLNVVDFLAGQLTTHNPVTLPLWLGGLAFLLFGRGRRFRALGVAFLVVVTILVLNGSSKSSYLAAAMTMPFAAGGVALERLSHRRRWLRPLFAGVLVVGLTLAPLAMPILSVERYMTFASALGQEPHTSEGKELAELPQYFADMFGWREKAEAMAAAFHALSDEDRARVLVFGNNYGRAGALDLFGPTLGLPPAIGSHNSYWLWSPAIMAAQGTPDLILTLGGDPDDLVQLFEQVEEVGRVQCRFCMPYESDLGIYLCRGSRQPGDALWAAAKNYS